MRLLYDALLPEILASESPAGVDLVRWNGGDATDAELVRESAIEGYRGVILWGRESLQQSDLQETAEAVGVALIAVEARDPVEAKQRILKNLAAVRKRLQEHDCLLVLSSEVRPAPSV